MLRPEHDTTIALTVAGALTPAGLGGCIVELMERGMVDFVISTGANLYHDLHYALNFTLHRGSPFVNDVELYEEGVIRIYDVLFPATVLLETDAYVREFLVRWGMNGPVSTAELHYALGLDLIERQPGCQEYSVVAAAAAAGVPIYTSSPGDSSIGMNVAFHELMNDSRLMIDPNKDVNEICAFILAGKKNGCVILGGGSPKNFYLQGQPTLWEVYGIPKGGNDYFIQITTDQVVWGGLSGATPAEAVSWGKVNPGVLSDTVVVYSDSTIAFPLFCEYAVGSEHGRRPQKQLMHKRDELVAALRREARAATRERRAPETAGRHDAGLGEASVKCKMQNAGCKMQATLSGPVHFAFCISHVVAAPHGNDCLGVRPARRASGGPAAGVRRRQRPGRPRRVHADAAAVGRALRHRTRRPPPRP